MMAHEVLVLQQSARGHTRERCPLPTASPFRDPTQDAPGREGSPKRSSLGDPLPAQSGWVGLLRCKRKEREGQAELQGRSAERNPTCDRLRWCPDLIVKDISYPAATDMVAQLHIARLRDALAGAFSIDL